MSEHNFPIPGSIDADKIVLFTRKHWVAFVGQAFLSIVLLIIPILIYLAIHAVKPLDFNSLVNKFLVLGFATYYLIIVTYIFAAWLSFYYNLYVLTIDEIIEVTQVGFFGRKISQVSLLRVQDVSSNVHGFFETLFGFGDVLVESAGEQSQHYVIETVPKPSDMCAKIMSLHDELLETEGRQEEAKEGEGLLRVHHPEEYNNNHPAGGSPSVPQPPSNETSYQEMLRKEMENGQPIPPQVNPPENNAEQTSVPEKTEKQTPEQPNQWQQPPANSLPQEGEVDKDHLNQGGSIDLN